MYFPFYMVAKYVLVMLSSTIKFIGGPILGISSGLGIFETAFLSITGMMLTVILFSYFGTFIKKKMWNKFIKKRKKFTPKNRRIVVIWKRYGLYGVAFLTPLILTPPLGTLIAVSFGEKPLKIILFMSVSAMFWALMLTTLVELLGKQFVLHIMGA